MANTTPNKESIRRICILHGGSYCYLNVNTDEEFVEVLTDISKEEMTDCHKELGAWCGMKFRLFNEDSMSSEKNKVISMGMKILPIETE